MCSGPAETGKTVASILKLHAICEAVPGSQMVMARKTFSSLVGSCVMTYKRVVQPEMRGIVAYGGEKPERFIYRNGSQIWLAGLDNPGRVLSSERDGIYVNQAEELVIDDWETLLTRVTGRGAVVANPQLWGDCNPGGSMHWIRKRQSLRMIVTTHHDNPSLYTESGELTPQGVKSMAALDALTGVRRLRLKDGIWATAEGAVYDMFNPQIHVVERGEREMKRWFLAMDIGYDNPAVILLIGEDGDGRHHCFKEFYQRGVLPTDLITKAEEWFSEYHCEFAAVDEAAAGMIADMRTRGINAHGAKGGVLFGIGQVQDRLKTMGDGRPRYTVNPSCLNHINEFESYVWKPEKDMPVKKNDHSMDAYRYLLDYLHENGEAGPITALYDSRRSQIISGRFDRTCAG
jgi:phage terminase large subunit